MHKLLWKNALLALTLTAVLATPALAQSGSNMLGLYFDPDGQTNCLEVSDVTPFSMLNLYLVLQNPDFGYLSALEAGLTIEGPIILVTVEFVEVWINVGSDENLIVGFATPIPLAEVTHLATFSMIYTSTGQETVCFRLHGTTPSSIDPAYPTLLTEDNELVMASLNPGPYGDCTAEIGYCVSATEDQTFDRLKSLYR